MGQSERQIGFSFLVISLLALPAFFVDRELRAGLTAAVVLTGFILSFLFKEFVIDLVVLLAGLGLAVYSFFEFSKSENEIDFLAGVLGVITIIAIAASVAIQHGMEGKLRNEFVSEFYGSEGRNLDPELAKKFGLQYTDPVSSFAQVEVEER